MNYTCSKVYDAGSLWVHEMGHALGIPHPSNVSAKAQSEAKCQSVPLDQASMCSTMAVYRTHFRTLDAWDTASLDAQY
ncbi:hypothetical protein [Microbacterium sp. No. 7]|uniref:hypothetical protein n=1 Tax=Microbacterium sp. No. 7 TaxID=1714373 RepID=UPI0012E3129F|nr:hypothetical protein [Microbacterium sp. No. 7]